MSFIKLPLEIVRNRIILQKAEFKSALAAMDAEFKVKMLEFLKSKAKAMQFHLDEELEHIDLFTVFNLATSGRWRFIWDYYDGLVTTGVSSLEHEDFDSFAETIDHISDLTTANDIYFSIQDYRALFMTPGSELLNELEHPLAALEELIS